MAGFWTGLVHGTLICGATLAALSLAIPRDAGGGRDGGGAEAPGTDAGTQVGHDAEAPTPAAAAPGQPVPVAADASPGGLAQEGGAAVTVEGGEPAASSLKSGEALTPKLDAPDTDAPGTVGPAPDDANAAGETGAVSPAEQLPDPIGSDFRRGSDDPPRIPDASAEPVARHVPGSVAASDEGAPPPVPTSGELPPVPAAPAAPGLQPPELFEPEALVAPRDEAPMAIAAPGRAATPGLDRLPETGQPDSAVAALSDDPASVDQESAAPPDSSPAAGSSGSTDGGSRLPATAPALGAPVDADDPSAAGAISAADAPEGSKGLAKRTDDPSVAAAEPPTASGQAAPVRAVPAGSSPVLAADGPAATRAPRPAPDLSIPRALFAPGAGRAAPGLPQPAGATPPAPDLSDINPGASR